MKDKVTMEGYIEELESQIYQLGLTTGLTGIDLIENESDIESLSYILDTLNANSEDDFMIQEEQNMLMACRNCQNSEMCDYCSFGDNMPPVGVIR